MKRVLGIFFEPPLAVARVGASVAPLESFVWETSPTIHGAHQTTIRPAVTLELVTDGSVRPYLPKVIAFRDPGGVRPVAPFFELWARVQEGDGEPRDEPVTLGLLQSLGAPLDAVEYGVTAANRKAQRRTGSAACAFIARACAHATDSVRKPLLAQSPHNADETPLVRADRPIPLGWFQVIRPVPARAMGVDLSALRVRFTPARGNVYGPPTATTGPASPLPPGGALDPATLGGRLHEIVPEENRILNAGTPWSSYVMDASDQQDPQPSDSYDGANVGLSRSWGVVDDSCDGVIEAQIVVGGERHVAIARVLSSCPDFAPDRRPFYSLADDLADRDLDPIRVGDDKHADEAEVADLFQRIFEVVGTANLDATRVHGIAENVSDPMPANPPNYPKIDQDTMTARDAPYVDLVPDLLQSGDEPQGRLPYTGVARMAHAPLTDVETLLDFLSSRGEHVERLIRPPFGRFRELDELPGEPNPKRRDPRILRDGLQDMRMPPYMRDSDETPLSLTYRQYHMLMQLVASLKPGARTLVAGRPDTPVARRVRELVDRLRQGPRAPEHPVPPP